MSHYNEYRCGHCHKLLCKGLVIEGEIEIKCKSCHQLTLIKASEMNEYLCMIKSCPGRVRMEGG